MKQIIYSNYFLQIFSIRSTSLSRLKSNSKASSVLPSRYASIYPKSRSASISCRASQASFLSSSFIPCHRLCKCQCSLLAFLWAQSPQFLKKLLKVSFLCRFHSYSGLHLRAITKFSLLRLLRSSLALKSHLQR